MKFIALISQFHFHLRSFSKFFAIFLFAFLSFSIIAACKMNDHSYSTDKNALNKIVKFETNLQIIRWEIFTTPSYQESVPGPTDYISLVIEAENFVTGEISQSSASRLVWIAPEAARPWMTKESRLFFEKFTNKTVDIVSQKNCSSVSAWLVKTNKKIEGISCKNSINSHLYFLLADYTS